MSTAYTLGLDLGQARNYTAVVLLAHERVTEPVYQVVHLQRFKLGTPWDEIVERTATPLETAPLRGNTTVAGDAGGVGAPVLDMLEKRLPRGTRLRRIQITGGTNVNDGNPTITVPKRDIVATTVILFQNRRIRIAADCPAAHDLAEELRSYTVTIDAKGHPTYMPAHGGVHDDLVSALCLAAWTAEKIGRGNTFTTHVPRGDIPIYCADTREAMER
jgi:hypothetical protein